MSRIRRVTKRRLTKRFKKKVAPLSRYMTQRKRSRIPRTLRASVAFPKVRVVRHKYVENISIPAASAGGVTRQYNYVANSMFDPNSTGVGHQPLFRDEMAAVYTKYTVISSYIKVTLNQTDTNFQNWGICLTKDTTMNANPSLLCEEYPYCKPFVASQRNSPKILSRSYNAARFFKCKVSEIIADDTQRIDVGSNPGSSPVVYFNIWSGPVDSGITLPAIIAQVEIIFVCAWQFPQDAIQS